MTIVKVMKVISEKKEGEVKSLRAKPRGNGAAPSRAFFAFLDGV
jgi:hypothetical protein